MANFRLLGFVLIAVSAAAPPIASAQPQAANGIINALIGSADFSNWGNLMSSTDPSMFPLSATLFVAEDSAFPAGPGTPLFDPAVFFYHIVPQRLTFAELMLFPIHSRLPTLLMDKSILITNNSRSNFTLDGLHLTRPDLFSTASVSVHGIRGVLGSPIHTEPGRSRNAPTIPPPEKEKIPPPLLPWEPRPENPSSAPAPAVMDAFDSQASRSYLTVAKILLVLGMIMVLVWGCISSAHREDEAGALYVF